ncbi:MAG: phosphopyruvate hydratase [Candidatus Nealsonbacteria bacterium]|nr:phosphopyruvate hydratase [Candidatus Nealsonbacteria bacterium]
MTLVKIRSIRAREILDSRANFTLEVEVTTDSGRYSAGVPSGASRGRYEAVVLDADAAAANVNKRIASELKGKNPANQAEIDHLLIDLDGSRDKSNLGANAITGVSMAICRAGAASQKLPLYQYIEKFSRLPMSGKLPRPVFNMINGGVHATNVLDFQEFMVAPQANSVKKSLQIASDIYQKLRKKLGKNVGDEGGFAPPIHFPEEAIELILTAAKDLGLQKSIKIAVDAAASQFYREGKYKTGMGVFTREGLLNYYAELIKKYPIIFLEDPFHEEDWPGFTSITKQFGKKISIIGDDLLVTSPRRVKEAKEKDACNGLILKVNQIGTVSETVEAAGLAQSMGWKIIVSHRSGETNDDFIADLAVGLGADFLKAGAPARGERVAKYNRLLKIEEEFNY